MVYCLRNPSYIFHITFHKILIESYHGHVKYALMSLESIVFPSKHFTNQKESNKKEEPKEKPAAWLDPDDLAMVPNPKLKNMPPSLEGKVDEVEFSALTREKFNQTVEHIDTSWAKKTYNKKETADATDIFSENQNRIPSESLRIDRVADLFPNSKIDNQKGKKASILQISFHPAEEFASVLDSNGCLHIIAVNKDKNSTQDSLPFTNFENHRLCMCYTANGEHIILGGKQGSFITVDIQTRQAFHSRIQGDKNNITRVICSPDNKIIAMIAGKTVHFLNASNKDLLRSVQTSDELKCGAFTDDSCFFVAAGKEGRGLLFDCDNFSAINRFQEPEMQYIHSISISRSRVAIGTDAGVLHVFDFNSLKQQHPKPLFSKMNLVTQIDTVKFNPTGELIVFASSGKKDSLRVLHLASRKVFSNWPTQNTPLSFVRDVAFDHTSKYLAIGNEKGIVTLWELGFYIK